MVYWSIVKTNQTLLLFSNAKVVLDDKTKKYPVVHELQKCSSIVQWIYFISINGINSTLFHRHDQFAGGWTLLISANACCHFAFWDAERKQQDASNGQAPFRRRSTTVTSTGPDGPDCDGSWSDHGCHFHNLLSGSQLFSAGFLAGVMAYRSAQLLIHSATLYRRDCLNHP